MQRRAQQAAFFKFLIRWRVAIRYTRQKYNIHTTIYLEIHLEQYVVCVIHILFGFTIGIRLKCHVWKIYEKLLDMCNSVELLCMCLCVVAFKARFKWIFACYLTLTLTCYLQHCFFFKFTPKIYFFFNSILFSFFWRIICENSFKCTRRSHHLKIYLFRLLFIKRRLYVYVFLKERKIFLKELRVVRCVYQCLEFKNALFSALKMTKWYIVIRFILFFCLFTFKKNKILFTLFFFSHALTHTRKEPFLLMRFLVFINFTTKLYGSWFDYQHTRWPAQNATIYNTKCSLRLAENSNVSVGLFFLSPSLSLYSSISFFSSFKLIIDLVPEKTSRNMRRCKK